MSEVIKEFLVALNYKVQGERDFTDGVEKAAKAVGKLSATLAAMAAAYAYATARAAQSLERLYYMSQRTATSAQNIKAFSFAASQLGSSAEDASNAVESLAQKIKETGGVNGGIANLLRAIGVAPTDGKGNQRDVAQVLVDVGQKLATMAPHVARAYASALGIDEKLLNALMTGKFAAMMQANVDKAKRMGFDINQASADSVGFMQKLRDLGDTLQMLFLKVLSNAFRDVGGDFGKLNELIIQNAPQIAKTLEAVLKVVVELAQKFVEWLSNPDTAKSISELTTKLSGIGDTMDRWKGYAEAFLLFFAGVWLTRMLATVATLNSAIAGSALMRLLGLPALLGGAVGLGLGYLSNLENTPEKQQQRLDAVKKLNADRAAGKDTGIFGRLKRWWNGGKEGKATGYTDSNAFYDSIIKAEGTGKYGDPYNTSLGYLQSPKPLTEMTLDEALAWGEHIRKNTAIGRATNSSAKGAFQIVNTTQRDAMRALGLKGTDLFNEENQRKMASWRARTGNGLGAWEGFKAHPDQLARAATELHRGTDRDTSVGLASRVADAAKKVGEAIVPVAKAAERAGTASLPLFAQGQPLGITANPQRGSVVNNFSPTNNITIMGGGPDMAPILGRTLDRTNKDLLRNGVGAFN